MTIDSDSKNLDRKLDENLVRLRINLIKKPRRFFRFTQEGTQNLVKSSTKTQMLNFQRGELPMLDLLPGDAFV